MIIPSVLLGIVLGILTGLLPGLGTASLILSMYVWLYNFSMLEIFVFYCALMSTIAYYGNVSSIIFGVHGEITSGPAVDHGYTLYKDNTQDGYRALVYTATGSFIAAMIALAIMLVVFSYVDVIVPFFGNTAKVVVLTLGLALLITLSRSKLLGVLFAVFGILLGKLGYDQLFQIRLFTVDHSNILDSGIPFITVFTGIIVLPQLWEMIKTKRTQNILDINDLKLSNRLKLLVNLPYAFSIMRGTTVGLITGLIPGISYSISSNVAAALEKKISDFKKLSKKDMHFSCVISAESANNSASTIVLIPLMVLAIPIIASEAIVLSIAERSGFSIYTSADFLKNNGLMLIAIMFVVNTINWVLSGVFYSLVSKIFNFLQSFIYYFLFVIVIAMNYYAAGLTNQSLLATICLLIFFAIGVMFKDVNSKMVMVFAFFLADPIVNEYYRFWLLNF